MLLNLDLTPQEKAYTNLSAWMSKNAYYGAVSSEFQKMFHAGAALEQAQAVLRSSDRKAGHLQCFYKYAMRYVTALVQTHTPLPVIHLTVDAMAAYDAENATAFCTTLYSYLRNERNSLKTSSDLYIHRNTLAQRLNKIHELWEPDLEDPAERFYLMYSFYHRSSEQGKN